MCYDSLLSKIRVDLSSEDDLSIDSDSDLMEIDQEMKGAHVS